MVIPCRYSETLRHPTLRCTRASTRENPDLRLNKIGSMQINRLLFMICKLKSEHKFGQKANILYNSPPGRIAQNGWTETIHYVGYALGFVLL